MSYNGGPMGYSGGYGFAEGFTPILSLLPPMAAAHSIARKLSNRPLPVLTIRRDTDSATLDLYGEGPFGLVNPERVRTFNGWNLLAQSGNLSTTWSAAGGAVIGSATTFSTSATTDRVQQAKTVIAGTYTLTAKFGSADIGKAIRLAFFSGSWDYGSNITIDANGYATRTFTSVASITNFAMSGTGSSVSYAAFEFIQLEQASAFSAYDPRTTTGAGNSLATTVYDHSGNDRHYTQASTGIQRLVCTQGVPHTENGLLTSYGVAADARRMVISSSTAMFNFLHTTGGTVLAIAKVADTAASKLLMSNASGSTGAGSRVGYGSGEGPIYSSGRLDVAGVATNGNSMTIVDSTSHANSNRVNISVFDPDNATAGERIKYWMNGVAGSVVNVATGTPFVENASDDMTWGATASGGSPFDGTLSEKLIYDGALTTAQRQLYEADAMRLWGLL